MERRDGCPADDCKETKKSAEEMSGFVQANGKMKEAKTEVTNDKKVIRLQLVEPIPLSWAVC